MNSEARAMAPTPAAGQTSRPIRIGRYLVFPAFALGGMASVHVGRLLDTPGFTRLVAIKRLHPLFAQSQRHYRMLLEEARITSRIRHTNVVPLLDVIRDEGELCLVMD
jgi:eukaryotic-like serine/threonine-protein kinase